ncbi:MAG: hypothetical protein E4H13_07510 [Calditrichales bacterium]|nr:MAG: hypothetical protein E4H13_07510 [Calditrichales bacterium]
MKVPFLNLFFRGLAVAGRFLILIGIGRFFSTEDFGIYGLFHSTVMLALYFIGFDFYTFNTREIIARAPTSRLSIIRDQFVFHMVSYVVIGPLLLLIFYQEIIPVSYLLWFYLILIMEHVSQELIRIFTALKQSVFANFITFFKSGIWVYALWVVWLKGNNSIYQLDQVWLAWSLGLLLAVLLSAIYLSRLNLGSIRGIPVNWSWIWNGLKISIPFFISTIAYKIIEFSNRYFIDYFNSKTEVGIFTFYFGIANLINIVVFTGVIMVLYPTMYEIYLKNEIENFRKKVKQFTLLVIGSSLLMGLLLVLIIPLLLALIGKESMYISHLDTYYLLILANVILNISLIPHYLMYIRKKDMQIMIVTLIGALANIVLNLVLIPRWGLYGAAWSAIISFSVIFVLKYIFRGNTRNVSV